MLDYLDDVVDDIQAIYGVGDPLSMPGPRFLRHAARLPLRSGAVAYALTRDHGEEGGQVQQAAAQPAVAEGTADDIAALAAASQHPGFPGIAYAGG